MRRSKSLLAGVAAGLAATVLGATSLVAVATPVSATGTGASHALIAGSGSSWAANAVNQWVADVASQGIQVVYTPDGDAQGRQDFANQTSDFAVTSIGYQGVDPVTGVNDTSHGRQYAYLPIAAGGTSFPYQIRVQGHQIRDLRLSGETLAKIFTNQITNWDDPAIARDNNGHGLPSLPITPVVQSEGSGATYQLTRYFATEFPSIWQSYSQSKGPTEYFPRQGSQIAQNGSNSAMNYVSSSVANGSIGYVEYSYPLASNYPVAKVLNAAGYYTLPTQYNVAVALEKAQINMDKSSPDYLLQNLDNVYTDSDARTYPLSSYVYMIEPTGAYPSPEPKITDAKRQSIADFLYYSICQGQKEIGPIGYSPLPVNLVEAGFGQLQKLKAADPSLDLTERSILTCSNPTFVQGHPNSNYLAEIAPMPPSCDKAGAGPCAAGVTPTGTGTVPTTVPGDTSPVTTLPTSGGTTGTTSAGRGGGGTNSSGGGNSGGGGPGSGTGITGGTQIDPQTGQLVQSGGGAAPPTAAPRIVATELAGYSSSSLTGELAPLAVALLLIAFVLPPVVGYRIARRRREEDA
jgi:ABC-type phosphate transport system substrate-binding protein